MSLLPWVGLAVGVVTLLGTGSSVMKTLLIPRAASSVVSGLVAAVVYGMFRIVTARIGVYETRDRILAWNAPIFLVALSGWWVLLAFLGFGLVLWPFTGPSFTEALRLSGSSIMTLGFAAPTGGTPTLLVFLAGATGPVIGALQVSYLPTLYAAFNRREVLVTMLESLGGVPAWGPEILARHQLIGNLDELSRLYDRWTEWAADISESHTTYRSLVHFRSPEPLRSWITSLLAVLDAAALHLALNPTSVPSQARPLLRVGYSTMRRLAQTVDTHLLSEAQRTDRLALTRSEFDVALNHLRAAGWQPEPRPDQAWATFRGWRINYEAAAYLLANHLDAPPALWSGPRRHPVQPMAPTRPLHTLDE
jgi:hypothetical protein